MSDLNQQQPQLLKTCQVKLATLLSFREDCPEEWSSAVDKVLRSSLHSNANFSTVTKKAVLVALRDLGLVPGEIFTKHSKELLDKLVEEMTEGPGAEWWGVHLFSALSRCNPHRQYRGMQVCLMLLQTGQALGGCQCHRTQQQPRQQPPQQQAVQMLHQCLTNWQAGRRCVTHLLLSSCWICCRAMQRSVDLSDYLHTGQHATAGCHLHTCDVPVPAVVLLSCCACRAPSTRSLCTWRLQSWTAAPSFAGPPTPSCQCYPTGVMPSMTAAYTCATYAATTGGTRRTLTTSLMWVLAAVSMAWHGMKVQLMSNKPCHLSACAAASPQGVGVCSTPL